MISGRHGAGFLGKADPIRFAHDGYNGALAIGPEKMLEPDAEDERDPQQCG